MKQNTLVKILFFVTFLAVLTGILLVILESNLPVVFMIISSVVYTACIAAIIALDNKYLLTKMSGLWMTNLQIPTEYNPNIFTNRLSRLNLETQKTIEEASNVAVQLYNIKQRFQTRYIGALTTRKVHYHTCRFAKQIKESNRINFKYEREAKKKGFKLCKCLN